MITPWCVRACALSSNPAVPILTLSARPVTSRALLQPVTRSRPMSLSWMFTCREETVVAALRLRPRALMLRGSVSLRSRCQIPQKTLFRLFVRALADTSPSRSRPLSSSRPFNALPREMLPFRRAWPVLFWMLSEGRALPLPFTTMNWICCQPGSRKLCV